MQVSVIQANGRDAALGPRSILFLYLVGPEELVFPSEPIYSHLSGGEESLVLSQLELHSAYLDRSGVSTAINLLPKGFFFYFVLPTC